LKENTACFPKCRQKHQRRRQGIFFPSEFRWELVGNDFHVCGSPKRQFEGKHLWRAPTLSPHCFSTGTKHVVYRWGKCFSLSCDYVEKLRACSLILVVLVVHVEVINMSLAHPPMLLYEQPYINMQLIL
jgi:hypothetical protein